jgi:hypothetical protein
VLSNESNALQLVGGRQALPELTWSGVNAAVGVHYAKQGTAAERRQDVDTTAPALNKTLKAIGPEG